MRIFLVAAIVFGAVPLAAQAETWSGTGELGLVISRGNSNTETFNTKLGLSREHERWKHSLIVAALRSERDGDRTSNRWELGGKSDFKMSEASYVYGTMRYENDDFAPFEYQWTAALGYGRKLIDSERTKLSFEAGPDYRRARPRDRISPISGAPIDQDVESELILRAAGIFKYRISETTELTNATLVEAGDDNTFLKNELGVQVRINARLAMKAGYQLRRNSETTGDAKKTDTLSTLNLVYSF
jgi:putative salt-induced outer membrane protein